METPHPKWVKPPKGGARCLHTPGAPGPRANRVCVVLGQLQGESSSPQGDTAVSTPPSLSCHTCFPTNPGVYSSNSLPFFKPPISC